MNNLQTKHYSTTRLCSTSLAPSAMGVGRPVEGSTYTCTKCPMAAMCSSSAGKIPMSYLTEDEPRWATRSPTSTSVGYAMGLM